MQTVAVIREFYAIRYSHANFGACPSHTHPHLVSHPLSENRFIVEEFETMTDAYIAAHAVIGKRVEDGPLKGRSTASGGVEVLRVAEHAPTEISLFSDPIDAALWGPVVVSMTITGRDKVEGIPHWASAPLSRYCPVNGNSTPETITLGA